MLLLEDRKILSDDSSVVVRNSLGFLLQDCFFVHSADGVSPICGKVPFGMPLQLNAAVLFAFCNYTWGSFGSDQEASPAMMSMQLTVKMGQSYY